MRYGLALDGNAAQTVVNATTGLAEPLWSLSLAYLGAFLRPVAIARIHHYTTPREIVYQGQACATCENAVMAPACPVLRDPSLDGVRRRGCECHRRHGGRTVPRDGGYNSPRSLMTACAARGAKKGQHRYCRRDRPRKMHRTDYCGIRSGSAFCRDCQSDGPVDRRSGD
jgi:hypothetical protein